MIVKIWGIKGEGSLKNSLEYIDDEEKMQNDNPEENPLENLLNEMQDEFQTAVQEADENSDIARVFHYISNEDKIKGRYISGYMCDPQTAFDEFAIAKNETLIKSGKNEEGYIAFHLVQSMPEGIDISDEEVHQCGIELAKKIGAHQAVIASHVHPVIDKDTGEIHGKCKHNHIVINAYIHPDKLDPRFPNRIKYHDCNETYAKLQIWNDQIALDHGLPIIVEPDYGKTYSWSEQEAIKFNLSWKEHVRMDIDETIRITNSWSEFVNVMEQKGYNIKSGKHITYTTPEVDGERKKIRDYKLGKAYTKDSLLSYWKTKSEIEKDISHEVERSKADNKELNEPVSNENTENKSDDKAEKETFDAADNISNENINRLFELTKNKEETYYVAIPLGRNKENQPELYYLSFDADIEKETLKTYFLKDVSYDICKEDYSVLYNMHGQDIYNFLLMKREQEQEKEERNRRHDERIRKNRQQEKRDKTKYYSYDLFINSRTNKPYRIGLYDNFGRRRSQLELMFILAVVVMKQEDKLWNVTKVPDDKSNDVYFGKTDWKAQRMVDSIQMAREENITSLSELDERLNSTGAALSRSKSALNKNKKLIDKMDTLHIAIEDYLQVKDIAEPIFHMPDGVDKDEKLTLYEDEVMRYNKAKSVMYRYKVKTDEEIADFQTRYKNALNNIEMYQDRIIENKEEYRKLRKLKYNASLAEDPKYCYGPLYENKEEQTQFKTFGKDNSRNHEQNKGFQTFEYGFDNQTQEPQQKKNNRQNKDEQR